MFWKLGFNKHIFHQTNFYRIKIATITLYGHKKLRTGSSYVTEQKNILK